MKRILPILLCAVLFLAESGVWTCSAQEILVSGTVRSKSDKTPLYGVQVYSFNTKAEAQDGYDMIMSAKQVSGTTVFIDAPVVTTNEEGYYEIHVAGTGALLFWDETSFSDPELQSVNGRMEINALLEKEITLEEVLVTAGGGEVPVFDVPEFDGEHLLGGITYPIEERTGRENARFIFQTYVLDVNANDTILFRTPVVMDGRQYHDTQLRRMGYDETRDPLYLVAEKNSELTEATRRVEWHDTVDIPDINKVYYYNCRMWMEDYNRVYYRVDDFNVSRSDRARRPMKFLEFDTREYNLDPNDYRRQARREMRPTSGSLNIIFPINQAQIDPADTASLMELDKLRTELLTIASGEGATLKQLHLKGVSSPEGSYEKNISLANARLNTILREVTSVLPRHVVDRTYQTKDARVAGWDEVADILAGDSLTAEAEEIRSIVSRYPNDRNSQMMKLRSLPYYNSVIVPALPKLRSVTYESVVEIYRELTAEEIYQKYIEKPDFDFAGYEYWHLFNMVKDEDELAELYRRALKTNPTWLLPANNLAVSYIRREIMDTTLLAPFLDLTFKVNQQIWKDGRLERVLNQEELVANQVIMYMMAAKYTRAGQYSMLLPDNDTYHDLKLFARCLAGFYKKDAALREEVSHTSPINKVVMLLASEKLNQAVAALDSLDMSNPVSMYLFAQTLCRKCGGKYVNMKNETMESDGSEAEIDYNDPNIDWSTYEEKEPDTYAVAAAKKLAECFRKDPSLLDVARADYDIDEKLLEAALELYNEQDAVQE